MGTPVLGPQAGAQEVRQVPTRQSEGDRLPVDGRHRPVARRVAEEQVVEPVVAVQRREALGARHDPRGHGVGQAVEQLQVGVADPALVALDVPVRRVAQHQPEHRGAVTRDGRHPLELAQRGVAPARAVQPRQVHHRRLGLLERTPGDLVPLDPRCQVLHQQHELVPVRRQLGVVARRCPGVDRDGQVPVERDLGPVDAGGQTALRGVARRQLHHEGRRQRVTAVRVGRRDPVAAPHLAGADRLGGQGLDGDPVAFAAQRAGEPLGGDLVDRVDDGLVAVIESFGCVGHVTGSSAVVTSPGLAGRWSNRPTGRSSR